MFDPYRIHTLGAVGGLTLIISHLNPAKNLTYRFFWGLDFIYELLFSYAYLLS